MSTLGSAVSNTLAEEAISEMRWSAVFAGWFVATGVAILLYIAGLALGFSVFDPNNAQAAAKGLGVGTFIWMILVWAAALFVGGLFASWCDGRADDTLGSLHGLTVWGMAMAASVLWLVFSVGQLGGHHGQATRGGDTATETYAATHNEPLAVLQADVRRTIDTAARDERSTHDSEDALISALLAGHDDTARAMLSAQSSISADEAAARIRAWLPTINAARDEMKRDADDLKHYLAAGAWAMFLSALAGLVTAAVGGWVGARHVHKVFHLRRYPGRP